MLCHWLYQTTNIELFDGRLFRAGAAALLSLISSKLTANAAGNAASVRFSDGQSFQDKLDAGALKGADGVSAALSGMYYFRYDETDGHLYVGVADDGPAPPLSIDQSGHLIYTIE